MTKSIVPIDSWLSSSAGKLGSGVAGYRKWQIFFNYLKENNYEVLVCFLDLFTRLELHLTEFILIIIYIKDVTFIM